MDCPDLFDLTYVTESLSFGSDCTTDDDKLVDAIESNKHVILVSDTIFSHLPAVICMSDVSIDSKIAFVEASDLDAEYGARELSKKVNMRRAFEIGYSTFFQEPNMESTRFHFTTSELILKQMCSQPNLDDYSMLCIKYTNAQPVSTELLLSLLKSIWRCRPELKCVVTTPNRFANKIIEFFDNPCVMRTTGIGLLKKVKVDILYTHKKVHDLVPAAILAITKIHLTRPLEGDIAVFLSSEKEIAETSRILKQRNRGWVNRLSVLGYDEIRLGREPSARIRTRRCILMQNEVGCYTCGDIKYVVDGGLCLVKSFDSKYGLETEKLSRISKSLALERASLAGAAASTGLCLRLYTKNEYINTLEVMVPEIQRSDLSSTFLHLARFGISDLCAHKFLYPPPGKLSNYALGVLQELEAIDTDGTVTANGNLMAQLLPLNPMIAKCLLASDWQHCSADVATVFAMVKAGVPIKTRVEATGDHVYLMQLYYSWVSNHESVEWCARHLVPYRFMAGAKKLKLRLEFLMEKAGINIRSNPNPTEPVARCIASGYFCNAAKLGLRGQYVTLRHKQLVEIAEASVLHKLARPARFVVYHRWNKNCIEIVSEIKEEWLPNSQLERQNTTGELHLKKWMGSSSYDKDGR